jgi:hypothetical protein
MRAHEHLDFTFAELCAVSLMGFQSAFLHHGERTALVERFEAEIGGLEVGETG